MCVSLSVDCDSEQSGARNRDEDARKGKQRNEAETHRESEGGEEGAFELEGAGEGVLESRSRSVIKCRAFDPNAGLSLFQSGVLEVCEAKRKAAQARHLQPCHAFAKEVRVFDAKRIPTPGLEPGSAR